MKKKQTGAANTIKGADGPTSFFILGGKDAKRTLKQKFQKKLFALRKKIIAKTLKADPHTIEQVIEYAKSRWGYADASRDSGEYKTEYAQMRASFILQYKPELLGELGAAPKLGGRDEDSIKRFLELNDRRQKAAEEVPEGLFDIDLHILKTSTEKFNSRLTFEKTYGYIGGSASGRSEREMRRYRRAYRDIYRYYGVSQDDINNNTKRYDDVLRTLAIR